MRVGIDIRSLLEQETGGVSTYTENLLINLFKIDTQNEYLLFYNSFRENQDAIIEKKFSAPNVKIKSFHFPNKIFNFSLNYLKFPKIDRLIGGVNVFFIPNLIFLALSSSAKKIITLHDLSFLLYPQFYSLKGRWWHKAINPKRIVKQCDKIIAVSENTRKDIIKFLKVAPEKVVTINPGINVDFYQHSNTNLQAVVRSKYKLPEKFILSLSAVEPRKNISSVISAFELFKKRYPSPYQLVITGAYRGKHKDLQILIERSRFKYDIHFLGHLPSNEKPALYQLASLFIYPSFYEGFGFPPLEAMAASLPVIASFSSSLSEVCEDSAVLVDPYNIEELAVAMHNVLFNAELSKLLVQKGIKQVQKYPWQKTAQETLKLFKSLVNDK